MHVVLGVGPAGTTLATELATRGHQVRTVTRKEADLRDPEAATRAIAGAEVVYHCVNVAYHLQVEAMPVLQEAILTGVERAGARLVVLDTLYPYGPTGGAVMTEDTPWNATGPKGRMRADLDRAYLEAHAAGRAGVVLGRSADFYGPGVLNSTLGGAVFPGALTGETVLGLGDVDLPHSYTYIGDVARGLALLGENPDADGRVWHLPTAPARTTRQVFDLIAERAGRPLDVRVMAELAPWGPFDEVFVGEYREVFYQNQEPQIVDSSAFQERFGVAPVDFEEGVDATLAWYRSAFAATAGE
ncbi:NAD-dependent epimerase/dehydratase family protein [Actinosynnema pretiosum subsp. pretiosum]|uniref:NAD-dependent epimerase/dehydratase n=2 Tax=Actinosynnema TaxID=40566 RepID=C6WAM5_ACTMD|nr:NAD-dependent epimerase/dehydratase family protein [Actinosynnema mirum]ACU35492.1 NAD-dependent epimerase/dehydratase [Actinosynnema mirum DSM 43827]AXX28868.1 Nucleoside-diphosphate-sugar epimerase [Actinosynnema pretiosum subsp. pretiosum]QUF06830.1 NAD-dependent epimerase/dehydratase family protein [Actinosynnema pretiosum subsp. pretiosum]